MIGMEEFLRNPKSGSRQVQAYRLDRDLGEKPLHVMLSPSLRRVLTIAAQEHGFGLKDGAEIALRELCIRLGYGDELTD
jgi:hypothetical protein